MNRQPGRLAGDIPERDVDATNGEHCDAVPPQMRFDCCERNAMPAI